MVQCGHQGDQQAPRPNVLLIMVDDLNTHLGCYGNTVVQTPHIDRLAAEGVVFERAYAQLALCKPSRASMLTGFRPDAIGITSLGGGNFRSKRPGVVTLPQVFREQGYYTARIGKVFHMGVPDGLALCHSDQDDAYSWDESIDCIGYELNSNGAFYNATPWEEDRAGTGGAISWLKAQKGDHFQHDYNAATATIDLLAAHAADPFFIACGFVRPHVPLVAPVRYFDMYDPDDMPLPDSVPDDWHDIPAVAKTIFGANFHITEEEHRRAMRAYYACVSFVDDQVGRLLDAVDSLSLRERTHIVFVSDHGVQLGEHDLWFKKQLFRESVNAPLVVSSPSFAGRNGEKCRRLIEFVDIFPTVLELCDLVPLSGLQGLSFVPLLDNPGRPWKEAAFTQTSAGNVIGRSVRTEAWCYNEWDRGRQGVELYHLKSDPGEFVNLARDASYEDTLKKMQTLLHEGWEPVSSAVEHQNQSL